MRKNQREFWVIAASIASLAASAPRVAAQVSEAAGVRAGVPFELGRFDVRLDGTVHRVGAPVGIRTPFSFESTIRVPRASSGLWFGTGIEGSGQVDSLPPRPLLRYGVWRSLDRVQVSVGATSHVSRLGGHAPKKREVASGDTVAWVRDSGAPSRTTYWSDVESRIAWRLRALTMEAIVGARGRVHEVAPSVWGRLGASYSLSPRFSLAAAVGAEPARLGLGLPASRFVTLALRVRPWRSPSVTDTANSPTFALQHAGESRYRITYVAQHAARVELSGDFDRWRPVSLAEVRPGVWETTLALTPGTYRVNVRVDGGRWLPPTGLPQAEDDFSGAVGVLVVR